MTFADDLLGLILAFEVYAAISKRFPLVTSTCRKHRWLVVPIVAVTVAHLARRIDATAASPPTPAHPAARG